MSAEAYRDLIFEVQALRRRVERDVRLGGALGVAGALWPHQVANVGRVLLDTSIRHVIADEVGLGKTVQAIMILKALLLQRPDLRVAIIVPEGLRVQWVHEMMVRANLAVVQDERDEGDDRRPVLLWHTSRNINVDLREFDVLIIDELPLLPADLQSRVAAASASVANLLILTATPPLDNLALSRQLFALIEPVRTALAVGSVMDALAERERTIASLLSSEWPDGFGYPPPPEPVLETAAIAFCAVRRLLRTRREVWKNYLPHRVKRVHPVEPTAAERMRQEHLWKWLAYQGELTRDFDIVKLAQRVRSPASLRQRVVFLKGKGHDRDGLIEAVGRTLDGAPGDSRYEGLLDTLTDIWLNDSSAQVLIAAGDNLTVDDLYKRLPIAFDAMPADGLPVSVGRIRNQPRTPQEDFFEGNELAEAAQAFQEGSVQVLLLAVAGTAGLNLQRTRHIVLYSVPWDPAEAEQLIGRVDRIGNEATSSGPGVLPIEVHVITQIGLVDHRVFRVIEATRILDRSVSADGEAISRIRTSIEKVGLSDDPSAWADVLVAATRLGEAREAEGLHLPLLAFLPTHPDRAKAFAQRHSGAAPVPPVLAGSGEGEGAWSDAALGWLKAMRTAGKYDLRWVDRAQGVRRLSYHRPALYVRSPANLASRPVGTLPEVRSVAFLRTHRRTLEASPPMTWGPENVMLAFFDHGSPLHEDLVRTWQNVSSEKRCTLFVPDGHACQSLAGGVLRIRTAWLCPDALLPSSPFPHPEKDADSRFLHGVLPAAVLIAGVIARPGGVAPMPAPQLRALLAPATDSPLLGRSAADWRRPDWLGAVEAEAELLVRKQLDQAARERWAPRWSGLESAVAARRYTLAVDAADADELFVIERDARQREIRVAEVESSPAAARIARKLCDELTTEARSRNAREERRDAWVSALSSHCPEDAIVLYNDAWVLLQR